MGLSQGGSQSYYALAKDQDFYADKVARFVALTTCIYPHSEIFYNPLLQHQERLHATYESIAKSYEMIDQLGVYNLNGGDESTMTKEKLC